jgi:NAD(P)-dependent dehydrogenase (short-subunit alcohol dehydrogenase family)
MDIAGRVAIVTGGASGIGRSIRLALADAGAAGVVAGGVVAGDVDAAGAAVAAEQFLILPHRDVATYERRRADDRERRLRGMRRMQARFSGEALPR